MKKINDNKQKFLLSFFGKIDVYEEKEVNGFWLVKQRNGNTKNWQVAVYTKEVFENYIKWIGIGFNHD